MAPGVLHSGSSSSTEDLTQHQNGNGNAPVSNGVKNAPATSIPKFDLPKESPGKCVAGGIPTLNLFNLEGKTALVTGANGGIGGSMARGLAEAGADIIIFQIPGEESSFSTKLGIETGRKVSVYDCDMSNTPMIRETIQRVFDDGLNVDILCNVAGISSGSIPILFEKDEHKDAVCPVAFCCTRLQLRPGRLFRSTSTRFGFCPNA